MEARICAGVGSGASSFIIRNHSTEKVQILMIEPESESEVNLLWVGLIVEGGLGIFALGLAWLGFFDHSQPLSGIELAGLIRSIQWGLLFTLPLLCFLAWFHFWTPGFYRPMQRIVDTKLRPMFVGASYFELLLLSIMAGLGEELFFRWCLQGGITSLSESIVDRAYAVGLGIAISSVLFGVCHWVNATYAMTTLIVGIYFGLTMVWTGSWLVPAISHAVFDFIALIYIIRSKPKPQRLTSQSSDRLPNDPLPIDPP